MYLKSLEIQGFKSFADKTVLRFGDDITAIVGPNGSGKSNISDAISWVMGEMSSKVLRGTRMEDVIFGGTQKRSQVGFAEATLVLDNSNGELPLDTPEVTVTRRYYRSGESEYYINKQSARLRDINELFMDTGLGREGYSNIGQGRIDEILAVKSTDRREVFEEAAGISKYRHRKEETQRRLLNTEDNLMRIGDKISELEMQVEPLRIQADKAQKYLSLREELKGVEITLWLESLDKLAAAAQKAEADYAAAAKELEVQHSQLTRLYQLSDQLALELNQKSLKLDQRREDLSRQEAELRQQESEMALLQAGTDNMKSNIQRVRQEMEEQENRSGGVAGQVVQQEDRIAQIGETLSRVRQKLEEALEESRILAASQDSGERKLLGLRARQSLLQAEAAEKKAEMASLTASVEEMAQRQETVEADLAAAAARRTDLRNQEQACQATLTRSREEVAACKNAVDGYALRQASRTQKREELQKRVDGLRIELQTVQYREKMLWELQRDYEGFPKAVRLVMQECRKNTLGTVYGPVSALLRTDDAYTVAIETALGAAMQNIVVASEEEGKAAIRFLKRCDGGRATFLPLTAIRGRHLQENGLSACTGFVGIASELVRCEEKFQPVIDNLLGKIVLVENLDHAVQMARKYQNRFKIVTLDGQVMNAGGSMTGGSASKSAGILSRANELRRLEEKQRQMKDLLQRQEAELTEANRTAAELEYALTAVQGQLRQAEDAVLRAEGQAQQAGLLVAAITENIESYDRELALLKSRRNGEDGRAERLRADCQRAEDELLALERELSGLTQNQAGLSQEAVALADQITALRMDAAAQEAESAAAAENVQRLRALAEAIAGDRSQKEQLIAEYETEISELEGKIVKSRENQQDLQRRLETSRQNLQKAAADRAGIEAKRTKTDKEAQEKNKDILDMEREAARLEQKKTTAQLEEKQIIDKLWDSYELTPSTAAACKIELESAAAAGRDIAALKRKISALGTPNLGAIEEFQRVNERYQYLTDQRDDVLHAKKELAHIVNSITVEMTEIFVREFARINEHFGVTFREMFGGGKGELLLEDPNDPLGCGIEIKVQPPGKQLKTITLLSGGEKAFVAIALYFAILKVRPTPFCLLDEIDAALDDRNVERFANYLRNLCKKTQFIVITHRRGTMEAADVLYGVTMQEQGISKILHLDLNQMQQQLGITD